MKHDNHILVVEDDLNLGFLLMELLEGEGYQVKLCKDGAMGLKALSRNAYHLCILDIMMPIVDGFMVGQQIKKKYVKTPFLFLTAKSRKEDLIKGYEIGADDYVLKPFDEDELLCKIQVILRRNQATNEEKKIPQQFQFGKFFFDYQLHELCWDNKVKRLTEKENEILKLLCLHQNQILRREEAVALVYGRNDYFLGRSFDVFISRLRKLLKEDPTVCIENVFKVGFILKTNPS